MIFKLFQRKLSTEVKGEPLMFITTTFIEYCPGSTVCGGGCMCAVNYVQLFATPWTITCQSPLS